MQQLRIIAVEPMPSYRLRVQWENGKAFFFDLTADIDRVPAFQPLKDERLFAQAHVGEWGWAVAWNDAIDMDGAQLYRRGEEEAGRAFQHAEFTAWLQRHGLSHEEAAHIFGRSRRTIINYAMGHVPIPPIVGLACYGYDALAARAFRQAA